MMHERLQKFIALTGVVLAAIVSAPVLGEWSNDPTAPTPVCTADYSQRLPWLVAVDGGFVASWNDQRRGSCGYNCVYNDVYAQKFSVYGEMLWPENGRVIAEGPAGSLEQLWQYNTGLADDGNGGALIAWNDSFPGYYEQGFVTRASSDAAVAWGDPGEPIQSPDTAVPMLANPVRGANPMSANIIADSEGGGFVSVHTFMGRFDAEGRLRTEWFNDPQVGTYVPIAVVPVVTPGDNDGAIVAWVQGNGYFADSILAHKLVDPETAWPAAADTFDDVWGQVPVYDPENTISIWRLTAVPDGAGGAIIAWIDSRTGSFGLYAQRVNANGNLMWGPDGVAVSGDTMASNWYIKLAMAADGEGGAVIAWNDVADSQRAQYLAGDGSTQWTAGGVILETDTGIYSNLTTHSVVRATDGSYIVLYHHEQVNRLIAQKLDAALGTFQWGSGQVVFDGCFSPYNEYPARMVSDGRGGAVVVFAACDGNIYASRAHALLLPELDIEKLTNDRHADGADDYDVPRVAPGNTVAWRYEVTNSGDVAFPETDIRVSDSQTGVTPVLDTASDDGDLILSPDETWTYTASAPALDLTLPPGDVTIVPGCNDGRNTYQNIGRVDVSGTTVFDEDSSHYCNMGDVDADGITDNADNCMLEPNGPLIPDPGGNIQHDTDGDDFGNICDPDFDGNLIVNAADLAYMKTRFFTNDPDADLNGNGIVNAADLAILKTMFFGPPGPSGLVP
jgi:hypothetical protein